MTNKMSALHLTSEWNRPYLPTGGAEKVSLLIEARGNGEVQLSRAPLNLSLVLDRSGSMSGSSLEYSKRACQFVIDQMQEQDLLNMVAFDEEVITVFEPQRVTHKDMMNQKVAAIHSGGCTNLSGGLIQGAQYVKRNNQEGMVQRVILLSDGHANEGIVDRNKLAAIAKEYNHSRIGITTIGLGDGFDEELMEGIADGGGGNFYYVEKPDDIPGIFAKELQGLLSVVAQHVHLTVKPADNVQVTRVYGYDAVSNDKSLDIKLGDLYHQEVKSLLLEVSFYPHTAGSHPILELEWNYIDVTETAVECRITQSVQAEFTNDIDLLNQSPNIEVEKQVQITASALAIEEAMKDFDSGDFESGKYKLKTQADQLLAMAVTADDAQLREESAMLYQKLENFEYSAATRKQLHNQKYRQMKRKMNE